MYRLATIILPASLLVVGLAACGDDDSSNNNNQNLCDGVQCGSNAQCAPATGACVCDENFVGNPDAGCTPEVPCETDTCSGHGTCSDTSGIATCACETGYAGAACDACATDYDLVEGACVNSQLVDCADITPPANGYQVEGQVTITYTTAGGWTDPADCDFACNTDYDRVGNECLDSRLVDCADITPPANAHQVEEQVTITYTTAGGWTDPADCDWACNTDYDLFDGACVNSRQVDCTDITPPANAYQVDGQVTITYTTAGGWTTPADCGFACNTDYDLFGGACVNSRLVDCADITPPANAQQVEGQVTITYTTAGGWTDPADCAWACNTDYDLFGGACVNSRLVDCADITPPANASQVEGQVTITYTTASGWTDPADCGWACNEGFHREDDACVQNVEILWCNTQWPRPGYSVSATITETIYGQVWALDTELTGQRPGIMGQLCTSDATPTYPVDLSSMDCVDATFSGDINNNDEYRQDLTFGLPGTYYYLYIFSGDGGDTWTVCDTDGPVTSDPVVPGVADITAGNDCDVSGWVVRQANSTQNYTIPAGTIIPAGGLLVIGRNSTKAAFETYWGVTLEPDVVYLNSGNTMPQINGDETYTLLDDSTAIIDGPTIGMTVGQSIQRTSSGAADDEASWSRGAETTATPGITLLPMSGAFVIISEFSDATGTGNYIYEFVELRCDNP